MDVALLSVLRDGLLRRSEVAALTWGGVELRDNGSALLQVRRSKTDPEGVVLYIGREAAEALKAIRTVVQLLDLNVPVFGLSARQIGRRVKAAGLGEGFTGHSGRVGMAQDLVRNGVELPALMSAGRWKNARMPDGARWPGITRGVEGVNPRPNSQCQGPARLWLSGM